MTDFFIDSIDRNSMPNFENQLILWVWNPDQIPPHVAISLNGIYFSLTVKGREIKTTDQLVKSAKRKKSKLLFFEIKKQLTIDELNASFQGFEKAGIANSTCSSPIFKVLKTSNSVTKLSELLIHLHETNLINKIYSLNLSDSFKGIPHYEFSLIHQKIKDLNDGKKS
ncbi:MAG: hypothetical protein ACK476_11535 [Fluviicola sp.]